MQIIGIKSQFLNKLLKNSRKCFKVGNDFIKFYWQYMMAYIFIFAIFIISIIVISLFYRIPCLRYKIAAFIKNKYNLMRWNGILRAITISYLKLCIGLSILI